MLPWLGVAPDRVSAFVAVVVARLVDQLGVAPTESGEPLGQLEQNLVAGGGRSARRRRRAGDLAADHRGRAD
jgi:hypothetical protein